METRNIDLANIALMIVSCGLAFVLPFEVFLFSYAVLGPLHYLTEISWLHKRDYFTGAKNDYKVLVAFCFLIFVCTILFSKFILIASVLIFTALFYALATVIFKQFWPKVAFVAIALLAGLVMRKQPWFFIAISIFLPTLIHAFIFTGIFMLYGALKNKSVTGAMSFVVFVLCALSFFVIYPNFDFYKASQYAEDAITRSGFVQLNNSIFMLFDLGQRTRETVFESAIGLAIMRFIAFAYTYHYLNWFSKTQVIKWHMVPKRQLAFVVILWLVSIALYAYDYYTGLVVLYFLSILHVILEFPLNYRSFIGIFHELKTLTGYNSKPVTKG